jgi:hypothetical protein
MYSPFDEYDMGIGLRSDPMFNVQTYLLILGDTLQECKGINVSF